MATLQKFKLLATQCSIPNSPTRSPTTSPLINLRRRKTLRMLLTRTTTDVCRRLPPPSNNQKVDDEKTLNNTVKNNKLKDLFVSSASPPRSEEMSGRGVGDQSGWRSGGARAVRPWSVALRQRLLRKAWRPVLLTIHE
ncbi:50S ribosomal protein-related [Heracleum sosnowskyi]|uniref:50S ribosomal protein-related n=1 Tax=Heracleum sosnowskyi TaxID=360622 RepID=A0AAD8H2T2_9APIA|nr:50S ribosomal protein-related [Heracleum sosnowskyi]